LCWRRFASQKPSVPGLYRNGKTGPAAPRREVSRRIAAVPVIWIGHLPEFAA
jgi:hypothetical protein